MKVARLINQPIRPDRCWDERWEGPDQGLITCWERGREKAEEDPVLAAQARAGKLVILPFKGGVRGLTKSRAHGSLLYLAMWQGLRGEDLDIDNDMGSIVRCTDTGMQVQFIGRKQDASTPPHVADVQPAAGSQARLTPGVKVSQEATAGGLARS